MQRMTDNSRWIDTVIAFWFDELRPKDWFQGGPDVDARIRESFASLHDRFARSLPAEATTTARGALAAVLVLDQFSRNLFRNDPRAFATDAIALRTARDAVARGLDAQLPPKQRTFLYMPFMHAEDSAAQAQGLALFTSAGLDDQLEYARHHREVIERFGRFPHRNKVLGRVSTAEELKWLEKPDPKAGAAPG
jgi:uncharacterized protein (DUF924 family)